MEYTNEFLARVYGAYYGCHIVEHDIERYTERVDADAIANVLDGLNCQLLLTPLSEISDEDAIEVAKISNHGIVPVQDYEVHKRSNLDIIIKISGTNAYVRIWFSRPQVNIYRNYESSHDYQYLQCSTIGAFDYLRSKGYDCGYGEIPSLIEAGIAIKKQQP